MIDKETVVSADCQSTDWSPSTLCDKLTMPMGQKYFTFVFKDHLVLGLTDVRFVDPNKTSN